MTTYIPRLQKRLEYTLNFASLKIPKSDIQKLISPVPSASSLGSADAFANWIVAKMTTVASKTISDIVQEAVQSFVNAGWFCNSALRSAYLYGNHRYVQYNNDFILLSTSFFQNLISKSFALMNIFNTIKTAQTDAAKFTNFGRVAKLLITFEPAAVSSLRLMQGQ